MFGPILSVGLVNVLLKIVVILVVSLAGEACLLSVKLMISFRLRKKGTAPIVYQSDTKVFKIWDTVRRLANTSYIGLFFVALLAVAIFPAELASDFGVDVSNKCKPTRETTIGICANSMRIFVSWNKFFLTSFQVEDAKWDNEMLTRYPIRQGFRKNFDGNEYFGDKVPRNKTLPTVIENCTTGPFQELHANDTRLYFSNTPRISSDGVRLVSILSKSKEFSYTGLGGVLHNYLYYSSFLTVDQNIAQGHSRGVTIFEYPNVRHLEEIVKMVSAPDAVPTLIVRAEGPIIMYNVSCRIAKIHKDRFRDGIYSYRFAQLSRSGKRKPILRHNVTIGNSTILTPKLLSGADLVRAVIAAKISDPVSCEGETFLYTSCGIYRFAWGFPLIALCACLFLIAIIFKIRTFFADRIVKYPVSSQAWSSFALKHAASEVKYCDIGSEEFLAEYKKFNKKDELGEYILSDGPNENQLRLRRVCFREPAPPTQNIAEIPNEMKKKKSI